MTKHLIGQTVVGNFWLSLPKVLQENGDCIKWGQAWREPLGHGVKVCVPFGLLLPCLLLPASIRGWPFWPWSCCKCGSMQNQLHHICIPSLSSTPVYCRLPSWKSAQSFGENKSFLFSNSKWFCVNDVQHYNAPQFSFHKPCALKNISVMW